MRTTPPWWAEEALRLFFRPEVFLTPFRGLVLGYLRVMFTVDDIDETLERLRNRGAELVGDVVQYKDTYRLCYIRGPEQLLIGLAQELR